MTEVDQPCQDCERPNVVWFAPNYLWNMTMGGPEATDDPGGFVCPTCFIIRAEAAGFKPTAWRLTEEAHVTRERVGHPFRPLSKAKRPVCATCHRYEEFCTGRVRKAYGDERAGKDVI